LATIPSMSRSQITRNRSVPLATCSTYRTACAGVPQPTQRAFLCTS
jgi:hypothetical protein